MTLDEFNRSAMNDHSMDQEIDEELRKLRDQKDIVIDSRLGFYWIPESFKVYLDLDDDVATARIFKDTVVGRNDEFGAKATTLQAVQKQVRGRMNNEKKRFMKLYGTNPYNNANFNLIVNTSRHSPQTVALVVFDTYQQWLQSDEWVQVVSGVPVGYSYKNEY